MTAVRLSTNKAKKDDTFPTQHHITLLSTLLMLLAALVLPSPGDRTKVNVVSPAISHHCKVHSTDNFQSSATLYLWAEKKEKKFRTYNNQKGYCRHMHFTPMNVKI